MVGAMGAGREICAGGEGEGNGRLCACMTSVLVDVAEPSAKIHNQNNGLSSDVYLEHVGNFDTFGKKRGHPVIFLRHETKNERLGTAGGEHGRRAIQGDIVRPYPHCPRRAALVLAIDWRFYGCSSHSLSKQKTLLPLTQKISNATSESK